MIIASKVGWFRGTAPNAMQPLHIRHQLEQTLINLGTDYLDLYFFHNTNFGPDDQFLEEAADTMRQFQKEGKIRVIGQSGYSYDDILRVSELHVQMCSNSTIRLLVMTLINQEPVCSNGRKIRI